MNKVRNSSSGIASPLSSRAVVAVLVVSILLVQLLSIHTGSPHAEDVAQTEVLPYRFTWPLEGIDHGEKTFRLKFILSARNFKTVAGEFTTDERQCDVLLDKLETTEVEFLEPSIRGSRSDPEMKKLLASCPSLPIDRAWYSLERGPLVAGVDEEFDSLTLLEKDSAADFYYAYEANVELYDLSDAFVDKRVWGTFAEDGLVFCNEPGRELCENLEGYRRNSGLVLSSVFDEKSCASLLGPTTGLQGRLRTNTSRPYAYVEYPNFHGFAQLNESIYRVSVESAYPWSKLRGLLTADESIAMKFEKIDSGAALVCKFQSTK